MFSLLEYIKIHRISLIQDFEEINSRKETTDQDMQIMFNLDNQIKVLDHLIKVAEETG